MRAWSIMVSLRRRVCVLHTVTIPAPAAPSSGQGSSHVPSATTTRAPSGTGSPVR